MHISGRQVSHSKNTIYLTERQKTYSGTLNAYYSMNKLNTHLIMEEVIYRYRTGIENVIYRYSTGIENVIYRYSTGIQNVIYRYCDSWCICVKCLSSKWESE